MEYHPLVAAQKDIIEKKITQSKAQIINQNKEPNNETDVNTQK